MSFTRAEHETVVSMNDEDDFALVTTSQQRVTTLLRNNPGAEIVIVDEWDGLVSTTFKIPARLVSFRKPRKVSDAQRKASAENVRKAQQARQAK